MVVYMICMLLNRKISIYLHVICKCLNSFFRHAELGGFCWMFWMFALSLKDGKFKFTHLNF